MTTDDENEPHHSEDTSPNTALCQNCNQEFDWRKQECPHCGWQKDEWVENDRYGLAQ